jgi:peroxiredoxin
MTLHDPTQLPDELPVPVDDGATAHLKGMRLSSLPLAATNGTKVDLSTLRGRTVVYIYPRTGKPGQALPAGWDAIPGARGCTPQSCSFRDHFGDLQKAGVTQLFGLSTQDTPYQKEAADRLHLPFLLLSDENLQFARALNLPTFKVDGMELIRRMTLIIDDGVISHVLYPVFPPDKSAEETVRWLQSS